MSTHTIATSHLENKSIDGLTQLETAIVGILYEELLCTDKERWTHAEIRKHFLDVSHMELGDAIDVLLRISVLEYADVAAEDASESKAMKVTSRGFVDYVQHFRPDIQSSVAEIATAITRDNCRTASEISARTALSPSVIMQTLRYFEFEGWVTLDAPNSSVLSVRDELAKIYVL
jgi:hypothetical protein